MPRMYISTNASLSSRLFNSFNQGVQMPFACAALARCFVTVLLSVISFLSLGQTLRTQCVSALVGFHYCDDAFNSRQILVICRIDCNRVQCLQLLAQDFVCVKLIDADGVHLPGKDIRGFLAYSLSRPGQRFIAIIQAHILEYFFVLLQGLVEIA